MDTKVETSWTTLTTCSWLNEAHLLQGKLENEGFECFIADEHLGTIHPMMTGMRIRVQVRPSRLAAAEHLLAELRSFKQTCASCGSHDFVRVKMPAKNWFYALVGFLFAVPMRGSKSTVRCKQCGSLLS